MRGLRDAAFSDEEMGRLLQREDLRHDHLIAFNQYASQICWCGHLAPDWHEGGTGKCKSDGCTCGKFEVLAPGERKIVDPATGGVKGVKLERFDLIPWDALAEVAKVYGKGAEKYAPDNWRKGYAWRLSLGALFRHAAAWAMGRQTDDGPGGTGCHHLACAAWHCLTLISFEKHGLGTDDRGFSKPKKGS